MILSSNFASLKKKVITTVLDTEHEVHYQMMDATHAWSRSHTTRIQEVDNPGKPNEHLEPEGHGNGFLWRMNTYWRFEEKDGGVYVESESISLTRDIPEGLGWMIGPFVSSIPARVAHLHPRHHAQRCDGTNRSTRSALRRWRGQCAGVFGSRPRLRQEAQIYCRLIVALMLVSLVIVNVQDELVVHIMFELAGCHPTNVEFEAGVAVSVTLVPFV